MEIINSFEYSVGSGEDLQKKEGEKTGNIVNTFLQYFITAQKNKEPRFIGIYQERKFIQNTLEDRTGWLKKDVVDILLGTVELTFELMVEDFLKSKNPNYDAVLNRDWAHPNLIHVIYDPEITNIKRSRELVGDALERIIYTPISAFTPLPDFNEKPTWDIGLTTDSFYADIPGMIRLFFPKGDKRDSLLKSIPKYGLTREEFCCLCFDHEKEFIDLSLNVGNI